MIVDSHAIALYTALLTMQKLQATCIYDIHVACVTFVASASFFVLLCLLLAYLFFLKLLSVAKLCFFVIAMRI